MSGALARPRCRTRSWRASTAWPVKEVAQLAAMLGRVFSRDLLGAVSPLDQDALEAALSRLVGAGLIYRHGFGAGERRPKERFWQSSVS